MIKLWQLKEHGVERTFSLAIDLGRLENEFHRQITRCLLCVPKIRFGNIGGEVHRELAEK